MFPTRSPAARRHRRKEREVDVGENPLGSRNIIDKARKTRAASRLFGINTANKNYHVYDILQATNSIRSGFLSDSHINSSDMMDVAVDVEENIPRSTVSVRRIKHTKIEKTRETEDVRMKSSNDHDHNRTPLSIPRSGVASVRVNKISKRDLIDENQTKNSDAISQESSNTPAMPRSKTDRINVMKIPRNKTAVLQGDPSSSFGSEKIVILKKLSMEMQPIRDRLKTVSNPTDTKIKTSNGVTVTKLSKTLTAVPSDHS